ncbi:enoyl-CoA hydratase/isomerase family protein [Rhodococcus opacus]|uniref:Enoyl-CoA hydratase n=1 Tax=Rhodococcus opacus TaxID=37919 RepID=A0A2S8J4N8_RHOOP|nr:enoyl-CoA hydratase/isomerase family protein [Rhodococcus opacus]PQP21965.1 enoyl-CoA hydratase [Rhodococcus opacus]
MAQVTEAVASRTDRAESESSGISSRRDDTVFVITLDAPRRNALTPEFADAIVALLEEAESDDRVTALVIRSAGKSFCSGADLEMLTAVAADPLQEANFRAIGKIYSMFERLQDARIPTLAAVSGTVVGAGVNLPLACDLRIVADDARIRGFGKAGVHPGGGHLTMLSRHVSSAAAAAIALFGQEMNAEQAVTSGFAWRSVPTAELNQVALEIAAGAGGDGKLTREVTWTYRAVQEAAPTPRAAVLLERAPQLWSMQRRLG